MKLVKLVVSLTIVKGNPLLIIVNDDDPSLTIVNIIANKICFFKSDRFLKTI